MSRRTFNDWLAELKQIVKEMYEIELSDMPEFDTQDARCYFKDGSSPSLYFKECLSEYEQSDGVTAKEMFTI